MYPIGNNMHTRCCQNERISTYRQQILIPNCDYYSSCFCDFLIHTLTPLLFLLVKLLFILLFSIATIHFICSVLSLRYHTCFVTYSSVFMHNVSIFPKIRFCIICTNVFNIVVWLQNGYTISCGYIL